MATTDHEHPAENPDELVILAELLLEVERQLQLPGLSARIGAGLQRETLYAISGFKQRFPDYFDAQKSLL